MTNQLAVSPPTLPTSTPRRIAPTSLLSAGLLAAIAASACMGDASSSDDTGRKASAIVQRDGDVPEPSQRTEFPDDVRITTTGDDCPVEFTVNPSPDFEALTIVFSETMLTPEQRSIRCRIGIDYEFPAGWRFWRPAAIARGIQILTEADQRMVWVVRARLDEAAWASEFRLTTGPVDDSLQIDVQDGETGDETPTLCGATSAHIDVEIIGSLFAGPAAPDAGFGTLDSLDTAIDWEVCQ